MQVVTRSNGRVANSFSGRSGYAARERSHNDTRPARRCAAGPFPNIPAWTVADHFAAPVMVLANAESLDRRVAKNRAVVRRSSCCSSEVPRYRCFANDDRLEQRQEAKPREAVASSAPTRIAMDRRLTRPIYSKHFQRSLSPQRYHHAVVALVERGIESSSGSSQKRVRPVSPRCETRPFVVDARGVVEHGSRWLRPVVGVHRRHRDVGRPVAVGGGRSRHDV